MLALRRGQRGGNLDLGAVGIDVLRFVAVKLVASLDDDLAGDRRLGPFVAEHRAFQLAPLAGGLDQHLAVVREGVLERRAERASRS